MPVNYFGGISFVDKEVKASTTEYLVVESDAQDAVTDPTTGNIAALNTALAAMSLLAVTKTQAGERDVAANPVIPTDDQAYRSSKLTVFMHDTTTGEKLTMTIPGRNPASYNTYPRSKEVILTVAAGGVLATQVLVAAILDTVISKAGNAVAVDSIVISGRKQG